MKYGATSYLPTLITSDFENIPVALEVLKQWFATYGNRRGVAGIHLEGPFISKEKKGIHPENFVIKPTDSLLAQIIPYARLFPIMMTIAPEHFTETQIKYLADNGIIVSVGHTNATYEQADAAFKNGASTVTHIFNAMHGLSGRLPGVVGAILNNDCYAGIIADMLHVHKANIQIMTKVKPDHMFLITDAVTPVGTDLTEFNFAGKRLHVKDGIC